MRNRFSSLSAVPMSIAAIVIFVTRAAAGTATNTNVSVVGISIKPVSDAIERQPGRDSTWWQRFVYNMGGLDARAANDKYFSYGSHFSWTREAIRGGYGNDFANDQIGDAAWAAVSDSAIGALSSTINFDRFKNTSGPGLAFGAKTAQGTMDPLEPRIDANGAEPDEVGSARTWFQEVVADRMQWGFNVLAPNPYFRWSMASPWTNDDGTPFFVLNVRVRQMVISSHSGAIRIDPTMMIPIERNTRLSVGYRVFPMEYDEDGTRPSLTVRLTHERDGGVIYFSCLLNEHETLVLGGMSMPLTAVAKWFERR